MTVADEEDLFRSVDGRPGKQGWTVDPTTGKKTVTGAAFFDVGYQQSVDRALLCDRDPLWTRRNECDGVVSLPARGIREIDSSRVADKDSKGHVLQTRTVDVVPDAMQADAAKNIRENKAHALVVTTPQITKDGGAWRQVRQALAWVANYQGSWVLEPP